MGKGHLHLSSGGGAHLHIMSPTGGGRAHLHHPHVSPTFSEYIRAQWGKTEGQGGHIPHFSSIGAKPPH